MGDSVNLAARLENLTRQYGVGIIAGEATRAALPGIIFRQLDRVRVKGRHEPVTIYEPLGPEEILDEQTLDEEGLFGHMLNHYHGREWRKSLKHLDELAALGPETRLYQLYAERIDYYLKNPPPTDWDGVFSYTSKL